MLFGTCFDGILGEFHKDGGILITDPVNLAHRYLHIFTGEPVADFDDQLLNGPALVIHHKITDMADESVGGLKAVAIHCLCAAQMRVGTFGFGVGRRRGLDGGKLGRQFQNRKPPGPVPRPALTAARNASPAGAAP